MKRDNSTIVACAFWVIVIVLACTFSYLNNKKNKEKTSSQMYYPDALLIDDGTRTYIQLIEDGDTTTYEIKAKMPKDWRR